MLTFRILDASVAQINSSWLGSVATEKEYFANALLTAISIRLDSSVKSSLISMIAKLAATRYGRNQK